MAAALAAEGYLVCVPFRRVGQAGGGWPGTFDDVAAAVGRLPALVAAIAPGACAPGRLLLAGHSAGAHLALWAAGRHLTTARWALARGRGVAASLGWRRSRRSAIWWPATASDSAVARPLICSGAGPSSIRNATPWPTQPLDSAGSFGTNCPWHYR
jgi:acetyl esterase/lipase